MTRARIHQIELQTQICANMMLLRDRKMKGRFFHQWLRRGDDMRMYEAAQRIKIDTDRLFILQHRLDLEESHSNTLIELLNGTLNFAENKALVSRLFYYWLTRTIRRTQVRKPVSRESENGGRQPSRPKTVEAIRESTRLFDAPAWPGPRDIISRAVTEYEGALPPMTPLHVLADRLASPDEQPTRTARRSAAVPEAEQTPSPAPAEPAEATPVPAKSPKKERKSEKPTPKKRPPPPATKEKVYDSSSSSVRQESPFRRGSSTSIEARSESSNRKVRFDEEDIPVKQEQIEYYQETEPAPPVIPVELVEDPVEFVNDVPEPPVLDNYIPDEPQVDPPEDPVPEADESEDDTSESSSSSDSSEDSDSPFFSLSLMFFVRMRRVCRAWAQRARDTVARRRMEKAVNAAVEQAMAAWHPAGIPHDVMYRMGGPEAMKTFRAGATVMKRKGSVKDINTKDGWLTRSLNDQKRFLVGQPEALDKFLMYYESQDAFDSGEAASGSFSFEDLKLARYSFENGEIGIPSPPNQLKKFSKIPENFFLALVSCVKQTIGAQVRRNSGVVNVLGSRGGGPSQRVPGMTK